MSETPADREPTSTPTPESFTDFKNSFSYGTRTDLNFKFLKGLSEDDAAQFIQGLLFRLTPALDAATSENGTLEGSALEGLHELVLQWQSKSYAGAGRWTYDEGPFVPLPRPRKDARLALLTSSGHFVEGDDPEPLGVKNMTQAEAAARIDDFLREEPFLSQIRTDTPRDRLRVRHGGYDVRSAQTDPNVAFPLEPLRALADEGLFGELVSPAYSFVGACAQTPLVKRIAPQWAARLQAAEVDGAVLVPV